MESTVRVPVTRVSTQSLHPTTITMRNPDHSTSTNCMGLELPATAEQWPALPDTAHADQHGMGGPCHEADNSLGRDVDTTAGRIGASQ